MSWSNHLGSRRWWGNAANTGCLRSEGLAHIVFSSWNEYSSPAYTNSTPLSTDWTLLILHSPIYMTLCGEVFSGLPWLLEFLVNNPLHFVLLVFLVYVPTASPELGTWRGWAHILFIFVPLKPNSLSWSSANIYGSSIFSLHSEVRLQCLYKHHWHLRVSLLPWSLLPYLKVNTLKFYVELPFIFNSFITYGLDINAHPFFYVLVYISQHPLAGWTESCDQL